MALPPGLKLAWVGDDFTGASDTLATLAEAGLKARLYLDVPTPAQLRETGALDAVGLATALRALAPAAMREALAPVARFLAACGAPVLHYKCCSTFDSAPHVGSLGEAVRMLRAALGAPTPALFVGGQPSLGRFSVFGQLFAAAGEGGVQRIDRHPTMSRHPVTPMDEADMRVFLARQGLAGMGLVDMRALARGDAAFGAALEAALAAAPPAVWLDVLHDRELAVVGRALWGRAQRAPQLAVGPSSVAQALLDAWRVPRGGAPRPVPAASGPVLVLAGSLSPLTARQVAAARSYRRIELDAGALAADDGAAFAESADAAARALRSGDHVLAVTSAPGPGIAASPALAPRCAAWLRRVVDAAPPARLGVAGGDTSSHALQALAPGALDWSGRLAPGVALCRLRGGPAGVDALEVMLKGGQMGGDDLFEALIRGT